MGMVSSRAMIKYVFVGMLLFGIVTVETAANITMLDSTASIDDGWKYYPEGILAAGLDDSVISSLLQLGIGVQFQLGNKFNITSALHISTFFSDSTVVPSQWFSVGCKYSHELSSRLRSDIRALFNVGGVGSEYQNSIQTVLGVRIAYQISRFALEERSPAGIDVFVSGGYGIDYLVEHNQGFINIGVSIMDWLSVSFDVLSFVYPNNPVINMGRLW